MPIILRYLRPYQNIIISVCIILFVLCGVGFGVIPAFQAVLHQRELTGKISNDLASLQRKERILQEFDEDVLQKDLSIVLSAVPSGKSLPTVFSTVEGLAQRVGVEVISMGISAVGSVATKSGTINKDIDKVSGSHILAFSVTVQGSLGAIEQFITQSIHVRRLLRLRTFGISFPKADESIRLTLQMDAFYEPFPTTLGSIASAISPFSDKEKDMIVQLGSFSLAGGQSDGTLPPPLIGAARPNPFAP